MDMRYAGMKGVIWIGKKVVENKIQMWSNKNMDEKDGV